MSCATMRKVRARSARSASVAGGVGIATGVTLFLLSNSGSSESAAPRVRLGWGLAQPVSTERSDAPENALRVGRD
jgi:hypothetical protein